MQRKQLTPQQALTRLEALCSRSERCTHELAEKLRTWGVSSTDSRAIIDSLSQRRFVDDGRFAEAYVRDKLLYGRWGRLKIAASLRLKRLPSGMIAEALETIAPEQYEEVLLEVMKSKARQVKEDNTFEGRTKLYRSVASRGFEPSLIAKMMKTPGLWPNEPDGEE